MTSRSSAEKGQPTEHESLAEQLRDEAPRMDDLRRARLERRVLARRGAGTSQDVAPITNVPRVRRLSSGGRMAVGALALAAAALIGFVVRGAMGPAGHEGPRFAIGSAFETREGVLSNGARFELAEGEEGRLEIGDVTAQLADEGALEVRSIDPNDVRLVLERGTAELAFHPHARGRQHLRIVTPSADVEVVGTVFTVHVDDAGTSVSVREGTVRVTRRAGDAVLVNAGESVTVPRLVATAAPRVPAQGVQASAEARAGDPAIALAAPGVVVAPGVVAAGAVAPTSVPLAGVAAAGAGVTTAGAARGTTSRAIPAPLTFGAPATSGAITPTTEGSATTGSAVGTTEARTTEATQGTTAVQTASAAQATSAQATSAQGTSSVAAQGSASELASPIAPPREETHADLAAVHPRELAVDTWAAHRPSSREIAAAWHDIDDLQARGQFERSLELLVRLERYAPASDQDEALFDRARTVQEALRRPRAARALYSEYARRFPEGRHLQEVRRRLLALGAPAEGDPAPAPTETPAPAPTVDELDLP